MLAEIGLITIVVTFALSVYATAASAWGGWRARPGWVASARNAVLLVCALLTASVLILVYALVALDFSFAYVADVSSQLMSPFLRVTALWGGQQGSVLFWAWLMSVFVAAVVLRKWERNRELMPYVIATAMLTTAFFVGLVVFITNPFERLWLVPAARDVTVSALAPAGAQPFVAHDGQGLNPLLRHFGMIGHPPTTYLGFTGFVIPFAFAIAALITGKAHEDEWIRTSRRWMLVAWMFLSVGLVLGGRWAYDVLGWGGFWGWDPVENAMLMPWLTATAFLHSVMVTEKRGMLKVWSLVLIILTYALALFGTFITRTGVVSSVHAFTKSALGPTFFAFIALTFLGSLALLFRRLPALKAEHEIESAVSREAVLALQNLLFLGITFAVFWGTLFPLISEAVTGTKITVGPPFFQQATGPQWFALLLLMGLAPLVAWRKQTPRALARSLAAPFAPSLALGAGWSYLHAEHPGAWIALWMVVFVGLAIVAEFVKGVRARQQAWGENPLQALGRLVARNPRRYGGYLVHLAVVMIALGFIGDVFFKAETQGQIAQNGTLTVGRYSLRFDGLSSYPGEDGREIVEAHTTLLSNGQVVERLHPRRDFFVEQEQPMTIPGVYSTPGEDVYVLLVGWEPIGTRASTFKVYVNPLINWTWAGGVVLVLGILVAVWPLAAARVAGSYRLAAAPARPALPTGE
jgi:cytochrome c-type biogenesis protein CcmF